MDKSPGGQVASAQIPLMSLKLMAALSNGPVCTDLVPHFSMTQSNKQSAINNVSFGLQFSSWHHELKSARRSVRQSCCDQAKGPMMQLTQACNYPFLNVILHRCRSGCLAVPL